MKRDKEFTDARGVRRRYCTQCGRALPLNLFYDLKRMSAGGVLKVYKVSRCKQCTVKNLTEKRKMKVRELWEQKAIGFGLIGSNLFR